MDLGITGRTAIVCGGSAGLGKGIATALAAEGVEVLIVARDTDRLNAAATEISAATGQKIDTMAVDLSDHTARTTLFERCATADILINNAGGPPVGDFRSLSREDWLKALDTNMLGAIDLITASIDGMVKREFGRILNVTSHMVKAPVALLSLSNGARAGLTAYVSGVAREVAKHNVTMNNLLPGQFDTDRLKSNHERFAKAQNVELAAAQNNFRNAIPVKRFGDPAEFGAYAAFLCSAHSGFVTGQNLMLDGGQYPGVF
jgi:3-oxoacyl-[acyl-carrier protein] reductase